MRSLQSQLVYKTFSQSLYESGSFSSLFTRYIIPDNSPLVNANFEQTTAAGIIFVAFTYKTLTIGKLYGQCCTISQYILYHSVQNFLTSLLLIPNTYPLLICQNRQLCVLLPNHQAKVRCSREARDASSQ